MADLFEQPISPEVLGQLIDKLADLKSQRAFHEKQSKDLGTLATAVEDQIIKALADQHLEEAAHNGVKVVPKGHTYPHVEDWAKFYDFIHENKYYHLIEKRPSVLGYRELLDLGRQVPGVVPYVQTKLSVTKSAR
jgi:hypothetical protein